MCNYNSIRRGLLLLKFFIFYSLDIVGTSLESILLCHNAGPFRKFSKRLLQNACENTVRHRMVCDVYFTIPNIL